MYTSFFLYFFNDSNDSNYNTPTWTPNEESLNRFHHV